MPGAILFDFDGVLVETEPLHYAAFADVLPAFGLSLSRAVYFERYAGLSDAEILRRCLADLGRTLPDARAGALLRSKKSRYAGMIRAGIEPLPGAAEFIRRAATRRPLAICSGSSRDEIETILRLARLRDCFGVIVAAEDVPVSKPDPAGYRLALRRLRAAAPGLTADACLVIEDSRAGILAAKAAGLRVVALRKDYGDADSAPADAWIDGFAELTDAKLAGLVR